MGFEVVRVGWNGWIDESINGRMDGWMDGWLQWKNHINSQQNLSIFASLLRQKKKTSHLVAVKKIQPTGRRWCCCAWRGGRAMCLRTCHAGMSLFTGHLPGGHRARFGIPENLFRSRVGWCSWKEKGRKFVGWNFRVGEILVKLT